MGTIHKRYSGHIIFSYSPTYKLLKNVAKSPTQKPKT